MPEEWIEAAAKEVRNSLVVVVRRAELSDKAGAPSVGAETQCMTTEGEIAAIIAKHRLAFHTETLLQCVDCKLQENPIHIIARYFNRGRCAKCGGYFKVIRA